MTDKSLRTELTIRNSIDSENDLSVLLNLIHDLDHIVFPEKNPVKIGYKNKLPYLTAALQKSIKTKHILQTCITS